MKHKFRICDIVKDKKTGRNGMIVENRILSRQRKRYAITWDGNRKSAGPLYSEDELVMVKKVKPAFQVGDRVAIALRYRAKIKIGTICSVCDEPDNGIEYDVRWPDTLSYRSYVSQFNQIYLISEYQCYYDDDFMDKINDRIK